MGTHAPDTDARPRLPLDVQIRNRGDSLLLMYGGVLLELSDSAGVVVRAMDGRHSTADIGRRLADEYEIDPQDAAADVAAVLEALEAHDMVEYPDVSPDER